MNSSPHESRRTLSGVSLLFVDDDVYALASVVRLLAVLRPSWRVQTKTTAEEALSAIDDGGIDAIITDRCLPGGSGVMLLERALQAHPRVLRVLHGSGYRRAEQRLLDAFLPKPASGAELLSTLESVLLCDPARLRERRLAF